jgi:chromosome segregation protein
VRLTRLELHGFKSFADRTVLRFDEGVTAIVGPNGCGKSNISDAVRWVLGEQRSRVLRGSKMEDVIFQGSSARRPVNVAEVSLVFENGEGVLPTPFREVVITRRLSRSGESEYLLNGTPCRLRDIESLLRGTGLGADAGVVIEQRMIEALLSDRPDDRRELFEEAAGIGLYRDRRRVTERRLEETRRDLERLDDRIAEKQTLVRSLARQRKRYERSAELNSRRLAIEMTLAERDMKSWRETLQELEDRLSGLRSELPLLEEAAQLAEAQRERLHRLRAEAESRRNALAREVTELREDLQALRSAIAVTEERLRHTEERRAQIEAERALSEQLELRLEGDSSRLARARQELEEALQQAEAGLARAADEEAAARAVLEKARGELLQVEERLQALHAARRERELQVQSTQRELSELEAKTLHLDGERGRLRQALEAVGNELTTADARCAAAQQESAAAQRALEVAKAQLAVAVEDDALARSELGRVEEEFTTLAGRVAAMERLEREHAGLAPAVLKLLEARSQFGEGAVLGPLSDFLTVPRRAAAAVERFLGMWLHAVLVRDREVVESIGDWHGRARPGPLLLLPLDSAPDQPRGEEGDLLAAVEAAPPAAGWVRALLAGARALGDQAFVDGRGAVWLPGSDTGPGLLQRRAELGELRSALQQSERARAAALARADGARLARQEAEGRHNQAIAMATAAQEAERRAMEAADDLRRRYERYRRELQESEQSAHRLSLRATDLRQTLQRAAGELESLERDVAGTETLATAARARLAAAETGLQAARDAQAQAQVELARVQARIEVLRAQEAALAGEQSAATEKLLRLVRDLAEVGKLHLQLEEQLAAARAELLRRQEIVLAAEERLSQAEASVSAVDVQLGEAEQALDSARQKAMEGASRLHQVELSRSEVAGKLAAIRERLEAEWHRRLEDLLASYQPVDLDEEALRAEAASLREQVDALGPVNPLAVEEHEEEQRNLEFLTAQRQDLQEAVQALQQAIREIDATAREMFMETFNRVRHNFREIFLTLFGGGECDLRLERPEEPLECDIEIHASPRGKRTQRIHLLSTGERALVALSLLFGIFLTKPSPFCLLDEVDAPLDDANIGRFVRMLNEFKRKTQFIVITHNPRTTTDAADAVYGVTMQEPGVSSVVSVRMRGAPLDIQSEDGAALERPVVAHPVRDDAVPAPL